MNFNNFLYIFSFFNGVRTKRVTEGKHFFLRNYSGLSWHLRERRYLLMTKRGPVEYVFSLKHYLACFAVFLFGLCSSLTILSSFIINVIKDDLVSPAVATPIVVADFIDTRALSKNYENRDQIKNQNFRKIVFNKTDYLKNVDYEKNLDKNIIANFYNPLDEIVIKSRKHEEDKFRDIQTSKPVIYTVSLSPKILNDSLNIDQFVNYNTLESFDNIEIEEENNNNISNLMSWFLPKESNTNLIVKDVFTVKDFETKSKLNKNKDLDQDFGTNGLPINPAKMPLEAEAYRILAGFDSEIIQFKDLLTTLSLSVGDGINSKIQNVLENRNVVSPESPLFFKLLTDRVSLTKDLRLALNYIPLKSPMDYYYISSKYGYRKDPITKKKRFHPGIDLAGTWHEDVLAPADGTVFFAGTNGGYGKMVKIKHKYGIVTTYGHLQKILVRKGQKVTIGNRIGKMGTTGRSTGQHLHYEIWVNKKHVDPFIFIKEGKKLLTRNILQASSN
jgi:murein DD-endopeptidase MepM/ murein hydrolase activator NlpD